MFEEVTKNVFVYYAPNHGSNVYLLLGKKITLIDSSLKINAKDIIDSLSALGLEPKEIDIVLLTHAHADHIGCASIFKNATIYMHELDAKYIELKDSAYTYSDFFNQNEYPEINIKLKGNEKINAKPFNLTVLHTPGHTKGSVCFFEPERKLLFSGDTLFENSAGRTDLIGGNENKLIESLISLKFLDFDVLLPGHGLVFKGDQKKNIDSILNNISGKFI